MRVVGKITPTSRTQIRVKMEYFAKIIQKKGPPIRKKIGNFSPRYSSNYILNEKKTKKTQRWAQSRSFSPKSRHFSSQFWKMVREASPVPLVVRLLVFLTMHQYPWICLNILENAWISCFGYDRALNMPDHLTFLTGFE